MKLLRRCCWKAQSTGSRASWLQWPIVELGQQLPWTGLALAQARWLGAAVGSDRRAPALRVVLLPARSGVLRPTTPQPPLPGLGSAQATGLAAAGRPRLCWRRSFSSAVVSPQSLCPNRHFRFRSARLESGSVRPAGLQYPKPKLPSRKLGACPGCGDRPGACRTFFGEALGDFQPE